MKTKYNERFTNLKGISGRSNVFLKYFDYIEALLTPSIDSFRYFSFEKLYIDHPLINITRKYKYKRKTDSLIYLTGLTGTGKTSLLKRTFEYYENTYVFNGKTLIIPFTCDNMVGDINVLKKRLATLLFSVEQRICERFNIPSFNENENEIDKFVKYIKERRSHFSFSQSSWKKVTNNDLLDELYENDRLELALLAFKFTMSKAENEIENVVLIMDDIESVGKKDELLPIYLANKINACLTNRSIAEKNKWCSTVFISCRHFIHRIFTTKFENKEDDDLLKLANVDRSTMESFSYGENFDMGEVSENIPTIQHIIEKRREVIVNDLSPEEQIDFNEICSVIDDIICYVGELLLALNVNDYRHTFSAIKNVIYNKKWLQKSENNNGAFKFGTAEESFFHNRASIFRALALGENSVYFCDGSIVPNLLSNRIDGGDLWILLSLQYLINQITLSSWGNSMDRKSVISTIKTIFYERADFVQEFENALDFLILNRLLLRGKFQEQRDSVDLKDMNLSEIQFFYPSKAAKMLWDCLAETSILFELFVDDIWIENAIRKEKTSPNSFIQFNLSNYNECIHYLNYLIDVEKNIRLVSKNRGTLDVYFECFGQVPVTNQLLKGLRKSHSAYFRDPESTDAIRILLDNSLNDLDKKITELSQL